MKVEAYHKSRPEQIAGQHSPPMCKANVKRAEVDKRLAELDAAGWLRVGQLWSTLKDSGVEMVRVASSVSPNYSGNNEPLVTEARFAPGWAVIIAGLHIADDPPRVADWSLPLLDKQARIRMIKHFAGDVQAQQKLVTLRRIDTREPELLRYVSSVLNKETEHGHQRRRKNGELRRRGGQSGDGQSAAVRNRR